MPKKTDGKLPVSVLVNTLNEETNIKNCLESLTWADEIIVVDMHSDDKTVEIARRYTKKIFYFKRMGYADPARQFALGKASHEWVLVIDADELVTKRMRDRIKDIMEKDLGDVIYFPQYIYFFGAPLKGTGFGPLQNLAPRFFKKSHMDFDDRVHVVFDIKKGARIYTVKDPDDGYLHLTFVDIEQYLDKFNKYTTIEAQNVFQGKKKKSTFIRVLFAMVKTFIYRFIIKQGFKDGFKGFYLTIMSMMYIFTAYAKGRIMTEYRSEEPRAIIKDRYDEIARATARELED